MTLKEQLEILRGEPIQLKAPIEQIPCIETSDAEKLCKHPVVSVNMITYNHEPYIRQAIEGVMMQQTDFEFELIIGEDASKDKTREICFEYQKKYPDKIRVLWSEENVNHLGGNSTRVRAHSRGEFIALCEGDDYWIDPLKLQKQVDIMRANPDVGLCFTGSKILQQETGEWTTWDPSGKFVTGVVSGSLFSQWHIAGQDGKTNGPETFLMTATALFRKKVYKEAVEKFDIFNWRLFLGDTTLWLGLAALSNVYFIKDETSVYRKNLGGACARFGGRVSQDAALVRAYYIWFIFGDSEPLPRTVAEKLFVRLLMHLHAHAQCACIEELSSAVWVKELLKSPIYFMAHWLVKHDIFPNQTIVWVSRYFYFSQNTFERIKLMIKGKSGKR